MIRLLRTTFAVTSVLLASGCATVTTGTTQAVGVNTDPQGADCHFSRDGKLVGRVNPTPGTMQIGKGYGNVAVSCKKDGFDELAGTIGSEFQAMTLGNILLGGIIGIAVDAASGALMKYPESVTFALVPTQFSSIPARDKFFGDMRDTFLAEYAEVVARIKATCRPENCETQLKAAEAGRDSRLAEIEKRRLLSSVKTA
ncbi:MAG: hypothetical protein JSR84_19715 [Proteobacteria bacterium]|nr:hypothetical protein [Pseudomonadota bacterium]